MTWRILIAILIFYTPYAVFCVTRAVLSAHQPTLLNKEWLHVGLFVGYLTGVSNSFVNAIIFISLNQKTRRVLFGRCCVVRMRDSESEVTGVFRFRKVGNVVHPKETKDGNGCVSVIEGSSKGTSHQ